MIYSYKLFYKRKTIYVQMSKFMQQFKNDNVQNPETKCNNN